MVTVQEQIEAQRKAIIDQRTQLETARKQNLNRSERELRSSGLAERGQRQAVAGRVAQAGQELTSGETAFESEVASKVPRYAQESYLNTEYEKVKSELDSKE